MTNSYILEHRFHEERERIRQSSNKRNGGHGNKVSMQFDTVDIYWVLTRLRRNVSFIIGPMTPIGAIQASASDRYQRFSVLWSLSSRRSSPGHPLVSCREAKKRANVGANEQRACGWHASKLSQLMAGDVFVHWASSVSISLVGIWYILDWARVVWLILI